MEITNSDGSINYLFPQKYLVISKEFGYVSTFTWFKESQDVTDVKLYFLNTWGLTQDANILVFNITNSEVHTNV